MTMGPLMVAVQRGVLWRPWCVNAGESVSQADDAHKLGEAAPHDLPGISTVAKRMHKEWDR